MVTDPLLPATLGYLVGLLWNQNNVTPEASPITSHVEYLVGQQICQLLGYRSSDDTTPTPRDEVGPLGWGHITCDGSVANLESVWYVNSSLRRHCLMTRSDDILSFNRVGKFFRSFQRRPKHGPEPLFSS